MPNIFTPNGDGNNDYLQIMSGGATNISLEVTTNAGIVVFSKNNIENVQRPQGYWDGTVPRIVDESRYHLGVYHYKLSYTIPSGERKTIKGRVLCDPLDDRFKRNYLNIGCINHLSECAFGVQWNYGDSSYISQMPINEFATGPCK